MVTICSSWQAISALILLGAMMQRNSFLSQGNQIIKAPKVHSVYLLDKYEYKHMFMNWNSFLAFGYNANDIIQISSVLKYDSDISLDMSVVNDPKCNMYHKNFETINSTLQVPASSVLTYIDDMSRIDTRHILILGDSVDRYILTDFCRRLGKDAITVDWAKEWHHYPYGSPAHRCVHKSNNISIAAVHLYGGSTPLTTIQGF